MKEKANNTPPTSGVDKDTGSPEALNSSMKHKLEEFKRNIELLEDELKAFRKRTEELERELWAAEPEEYKEQPESAARQPSVTQEIADEEESEGDKYLASIQPQIHAIIRDEVEHMEQKAAPRAVMSDTMVCPSCGGAVGRTEELCPHCKAKTELEGESGARVFPLSAEKFLYVFNDRFGWFIRMFEKARHLADSKNEYEDAANLLKVLVQFMEENLDLLKSKHRDFKLALAYAYLGRCYFQAGKYNDAITSYKKGIFLKASNSYNCEIGLSAVYRTLVRQMRETQQRLDTRQYPTLSPAEIAKLNKLGFSFAA
jgi:tetratricopeptide (TPR) repeat protein